mmetsp:Transcript_4760/g.11309  ORF Transcript_4760/g.11309 Transcript_4760/m.11309 type:complete len:216 (-) Transcript_4760:1349-1996(-)
MKNCSWTRPSLKGSLTWQLCCRILTWPPIVSDFWQISKQRVFGVPLESCSSSSSSKNHVNLMVPSGRARAMTSSGMGTLSILAACGSGDWGCVTACAAGAATVSGVGACGEVLSSLLARLSQSGTTLLPSRLPKTRACGDALDSSATGPPTPAAASPLQGSCEGLDGDSLNAVKMGLTGGWGLPNCPGETATPAASSGDVGFAGLLTGLLAATLS